MVASTDGSGIELLKFVRISNFPLERDFKTIFVAGAFAWY